MAVGPGLRTTGVASSISLKICHSSSGGGHDVRLFLALVWLFGSSGARCAFLVTVVL